MRRHTAAFVILLDLVLLQVIANAGSTAPTDQARRAAARRAAAHPAAAGLAARQHRRPVHHQRRLRLQELRPPR